MKKKILLPEALGPRPKILLAPNAFKGSLSAREAAEALARGIRTVLPRAVLRLMPLADGGDGTLDVLRRAWGASLRKQTVTGPLGRPVRAAWAYHAPSRTAVIELAQASGITHVPLARRDPTRTTSRGTGELLRAALEAGARRVILTVGGSATVDGGLGLLAALGVNVWLRRGDTVFRPQRPLTGADLGALEFIDSTSLDPRWRRVNFSILCDVRNPLLGPRGAARVYGPQKGATPVQVRFLEKGLRLMANAVAASTGRDARTLPGGGAAGGAPAFLRVLAGARLEAGTDVVFKAVGTEAGVRWADGVVTGEGRVDATSLDGKVLGALATLCRKYKKPLWVVSGEGRLPPGTVPGAEGWEVSRGLPWNRAKAEAAPLLARGIEKILRGKYGL